MADQAKISAFETRGPTVPLVLGVEEPGTSGISWRVFDRPFVVVGRDPGADLVLQDPAMSRRHAYFHIIDGRLFCVDLQSRTGTHWGDEPGLWGWVDPDAGVRVGPFRIRPREGPPGVGLVSSPGGGSTLPVPLSKSFAQPELEELTLELAGRTAGPTTWRASRTLILIGGSPSCKIRLIGGEVAPIHAAILRTPAGVFAIDLLGPGGILVNGRRDRCVRLQQGDELMIAAHKIRVHRGSGQAPTLPPRPVGRREAADDPSRTTAVGDDLDSLVGSMLGEFARVQDQSAERLQATMMAVVESFVGIHQEQMALIREELGQIRALTEEQAGLRSRVEGQARAVGGPTALRLVSGEPRSPSGRQAPILDFASPTQPVPPPPKLAIGPSLQAGAGIGRTASLGGSPPPGAASLPDDGEFHARIFDRLAEIQGERQGRWQKLMESLIGKVS